MDVTSISPGLERVPAAASAVLDTTTNTVIHERLTPNAYAIAAETSPNGAYLYVVGNRP